MLNAPLTLEKVSGMVLLEAVAPMVLLSPPSAPKCQFTLSTFITAMTFFSLSPFTLVNRLSMLKLFGFTYCWHFGRTSPPAFLLSCHHWEVLLHMKMPDKWLLLIESPI